MDARTLQKAMPGLSESRAKQLVGPCNKAMIKGGITTQARAAAFLAQIGHESVSLRYKEEIGPQPYWVRYGGGSRYHGRTFIQVTHDYNYRAFGRWLGVGDKFLNNPEALEADKYAFLGAVWFWTTHNLNRYADVYQFDRITRIINGGYNGKADRDQRWSLCKSLGADILPKDSDPLAGLTKTERGWVQKRYYHYNQLVKYTNAKTAKGKVLYAKNLGWSRYFKRRIQLQMRALIRDNKNETNAKEKTNRRHRYNTLKAAYDHKLKL